MKKSNISPGGSSGLISNSRHRSMSLQVLASAVVVLDSESTTPARVGSVWFQGDVVDVFRYHTSRSVMSKPVSMCY